MQTQNLMEVEIFTDGSARGNPKGPGGYGAVLRYRSPSGKLYERELSQGYVCTSNNRMELMAAIAGLEALVKPCCVTLYSDSQYLVRAFNDHWVEEWIRVNWRRGRKSEVKNIDLWERLLQAAKPHRITWIWVKGHAGHPLNERCDKLATQAADGKNLLTDPGASFI